MIDPSSTTKSVRPEPVAEPPAPPAEGEIAELIAQLRSRHYGPAALDRAAELLERHAAPVPEGREPAAVAEQPSDEELLGLHCLTTKQLRASGKGECNHLTAFARAVLARWGRPAPADPPAATPAEIGYLLFELSAQSELQRVQGYGTGADALTRAAELLERHAAPVPVPGVAHTRYEFSVCDETGMEVAGGSAPTYAQALSEGRHYLAQYQQDEPHTLELCRVEVLDPDALPLPQGGEVEP